MHGVPSIGGRAGSAEIGKLYEAANYVQYQVFPLPVEGAETKVLADDQEVANYMIDLGDSLETVSSICHD